MTAQQNPKTKNVKPAKPQAGSTPARKSKVKLSLVPVYKRGPTVFCRNCGQAHTVGLVFDSMAVQPPARKTQRPTRKA